FLRLFLTYFNFHISLHDALPISTAQENDGPYHYLDAIESDLANLEQAREQKSWDELQLFMEKSTFKRLSGKRVDCDEVKRDQVRDRKSTRLNSSHVSISYAVFCL